ncbi:CPBP family glutamic-type intramembrane protease [Romboutsia sp. 1001713B170207_170306_H8]|uniref:CPBP family glutamic-type intramembrane protease n=2 Tax=unclassified Romboutsia TaxID=2626894 RepID=UPI000822BC06|nr:CPBP family glutamic-type intramembrane protease [Romboutsia sp. 1001713B170207_170306_H8]SCH91432.1 CAAX amino terminal protease self-immunity [uncultured Clostridium sp.]
MKSRANYKEYILDSIFIIFVVQLARISIKFILLSQLNLSLINLIITSIISFLIVGTFFVLIFKDNEKFNPSRIKIINMLNNQSKQIRIIIGTIFLICLFLSIYFNDEYDIYNIGILILSIIIIPIFEELLFREYIWNYLSNYTKNTLIVFICITVIYALYQVGYIDIIKQYMQVTHSPGYVVDSIMISTTKGLIMGSLLGIAKIKLKDTSICMLLHGIFSIFF